MSNPYLEVVLKAHTVQASAARVCPEPKREPVCHKCGHTLAAQMHGVCLQDFCPYNLN